MATVEHESQVRSADGLAILTGLWLMIAPAVIGFGSTGMKWSSVITGLIIAALGVTQEATLRGTWENWVTMGAGVWAIVAPFVFSGTTNAAALGIRPEVLRGAGPAMRGIRYSGIFSRPDMRRMSRETGCQAAAELQLKFLSR